MNPPLTRRSLVGFGCALPLLALPGCVRFAYGRPFEDAVRRLLRLAARRAFARLLVENGFFRDEIAQVTLPPQLGGTGATSLLAALLQSSAVRQQLLWLVNRAASEAAAVAAPLVANTIRGMDFADAASIARGGPTAATEHLQRMMGDAIFNAMLSRVGPALRVRDNGLLDRALRAATGIDLSALQRDVARKASEGIYRAIGREEAAIRTDPSTTRDRLLMSIFKPLRSRP
ncbi:MAG TPA: DUF4197 family protein [Allosphingosinicella sp.]|nr:DUF4197 family protein [Allosphingosinicella sp.]